MKSIKHSSKKRSETANHLQNTPNSKRFDRLKIKECLQLANNLENKRQKRKAKTDLKGYLSCCKLNKIKGFIK